MLSLGKKIMIFDGGMGSELVKTGIPHRIPEDLNITHPDVIKEIHKSYADADFITTNTFGLNKFKYKGDYAIPLVAQKAIENARAAGKRVFFDIGPTGLLLKPFGTLDFDDAYEAFREVVLASREATDGYIVETFSDLYELKAALLAIKENSDKPVFATMTFDKSGRTLTGTTPEIMVAFLEEVGVDALGVNCSLGPKELSGVVSRIIKAAHTPVIVQPNRGLPRLVDGVSVYDLSVEDFSACAYEFAKMGVSVLGGCCGTSPSFISAIAKFKDMDVLPLKNPRLAAAISYSKYVEITADTKFESLVLDGSVTEDDAEDLAYEVLDLVDDGADVVSLVPEGVTPATLKALIEKVQELSNMPLRLDCEDEDLQKCFKRYYNGVAG
ncbi:MAG: homocysteine S-methyltransferase family protein [Clostridia bacterium]|nr:homocysteine S-methyltransferase family protein [Clostridia bacterium]